MKTLILTNLLVGLILLQHCLSYENEEISVDPKKTKVFDRQEGYDDIPEFVEAYENVTIKYFNGSILPKLPDCYKTVKVLSIFDSKFLDIKTEAFTNLNKLEILHLSRNKNFADITKGNFKGLNRLRKLCICSNDLRNIETDSFKPMENLQNLIMSNNQDLSIESIKNNVKFLTQLKQLKMNALRLSKSDIVILEPISKALERLELSSNHILDIEKDTFKTFNNLISLDLKNSRISTIEPESFKNPANLNQLDLSSNLIVQIEKDAFKGLKNLTVLKLNNNTMHTLEGDAYDWNRLTTLNLENNSWDCSSCKLKWMSSSKTPFFKHLICSSKHSGKNLVDTVKKISCSSGFPAAAIVIITILVIGLVGAVAFYIYIRQRKIKLLGKSAEYSQVYNKTTTTLA